MELLASTQAHTQKKKKKTNDQLLLPEPSDTALPPVGRRAMRLIAALLGNLLKSTSGLSSCYSLWVISAFGARALHLRAGLDQSPCRR